MQDEEDRDGSGNDGKNNEEVDAAGLGDGIFRARLVHRFGLTLPAAWGLKLMRWILIAHAGVGLEISRLGVRAGHDELDAQVVRRGLSVISRCRVVAKGGIGRQPFGCDNGIMPLRRLTGRERSRWANVRLAVLLAFAAGIVDVSSYLGLRQFTSHMSGMTATLALSLGRNGRAIFTDTGLILSSFLCGAAVCALLVNFSRRRDGESQFALPLLLESLMLAAVALSIRPNPSPALPLSVLAFAMGLQNAIITKISDAEIRTTHVTGTITDIGIELGRAAYWNRSATRPPVRADRQRLGMLVALVFAFLSGGVAAAAAYPRYGFMILFPVALLLAVPTVLPVYTDLRKIADA